MLSPRQGRGRLALVGMIADRGRTAAGRMDFIGHTDTGFDHLRLFRRNRFLFSAATGRAHIWIICHPLLDGPSACHANSWKHNDFPPILRYRVGQNRPTLRKSLSRLFPIAYSLRQADAVPPVAATHIAAPDISVWAAEVEDHLTSPIRCRYST